MQSPIWSPGNHAGREHLRGFGQLAGSCRSQNARQVYSPGLPSQTQLSPGAHSPIGAPSQLAPSGRGFDSMSGKHAKVRAVTAPTGTGSSATSQTKCSGQSWTSGLHLRVHTPTGLAPPAHPSSCWQKGKQMPGPPETAFSQEGASEAYGSQLQCGAQKQPIPSRKGKQS